MSYLQITLVACALTHCAWGTSIVQFGYNIKPSWADEPEEPWSVDLTEKRWKSLKDGAKDVGLLFAGKAEFPWIVDIRVKSKDQDYWSIGNLIKTNTVFTTCRTIDDIGKLNIGKGGPRVTFAQMNVFEFNHKTRPKTEEWHRGGTRKVSETRKHPKCNTQNHYYDGGLLILNAPFLPYPPTLSTIQLNYNYRLGLMADSDLSKMNEQRRICYIASYGRDYTNIKDHMVKDFKVKYRVYWENNSLCYTYSYRMCPSRYFTDVRSCITAAWNPDEEGKELMCFKSRARVGAVCDHDKGAPLVCDGKVFGLVVMGAREDFCNDLLPLPFWVQKITMFTDYFKSPPTSYPIRRRNSAISLRSLVNVPFMLMLVAVRRLFLESLTVP